MALQTYDYAICITTVDREDVAIKIKNAVLSKRLAACVTVVPFAKSYYHWRDKIESSEELLIIFKTRMDLVDELKREVLVNHTYEVAEFLVLLVVDGSMHYLDWIDREIKKE
jgi:periplasmic divalent cation tolerance protein